MDKVRMQECANEQMQVCKECLERMVEGDSKEEGPAKYVDEVMVSKVAGENPSLNIQPTHRALLA